MVRYLELAWDDENIDHIARHGVEPDEVYQVIESERFFMTRLRGRRYMILGQTDTGRYLFIIVDREWNSEFSVVTARTADSDERRMYHRRGHR